MKFPASLRMQLYLAPVAAFAFSSVFLSAATAEERTKFTDSIRPFETAVAAAAHPLTSEHLKKTAKFEVSLRMRNFADFLAKIGTGVHVSEADLERDYLPLPGDYAAVSNWLKKQGFAVTQADPHRVGVFARGTLSQVQKHLSVEMARVTMNGREYFSARTAPSLPKQIASGVLGVNGLQPHLQAHHQPGRMSTTGLTPPFLVKQILGAYNANALGVTGNGQTIGILIDTQASATDLTHFWTNNSIVRTGVVETVNVNSASLPATSGEETMDEEWSGGVAPGAKIRVYATGALDFGSLDVALQRIIGDVSGATPAQPNLHQLSISLGLDERDVGTAQMRTDSQYFALLANAGVSVFVSSGDGGSNPTSSGNSGGRTAQVEYFASDPSVTGVGGTSLTLNSTTGAAATETAWADSGGGASSYFSRPSWQTGATVPYGTHRLVPDVSLDANPNTGAYVFFNGSAQQFGGTSLGAPVWAGFCALLNEARAKTGLGPVGLLNAKVYPLVGTSNLRDITSGNNGYAAAVGYDQVTGVGVPSMSALLQTLSGTSTVVVTGSAAPIIASLAPSTGPVGTSVTVSGSNFAGATLALFNGVNAAFTINSGTQITATVPSGATTGKLTVTNAAGTGTSAGVFTVVTSGSTILTSGTLYATSFEPSEGYNVHASLAGQNGWTVSGQGWNGFMSGYFPGGGYQGYIGYSAPVGTTSEAVYRPVNYTPVAGDIIGFSVQMAVQNSWGGYPRDAFRWSVYNTVGHRLFSVVFDTATNAITYLLDDGKFYPNASNKTLVYGGANTLTITIDFAHNKWSAAMSGTTLVSNQAVTTSGAALTFGDIDAIWLPSASIPGNNYMVFDNYTITKSH